MIRKNRSALNTTQGPLQEGQSLSFGSPLPSPNKSLRFLMVTAITVFVSEALIMFVLPVFPKLGLWETAFVDASLILLCSLPALYFWLYRPLFKSLTECHKAEVVLRESEEKFRKILTSSPDAIMLFDVESRQFLDVNEAAVRLYGYSRVEFLKIEHSAITAEIEASDDSIMEMVSGELSRIPLRYHKKKDGTVFPVDISGSTFLFKGREVACGIVRDISERKRAEGALRESEERLHHTFEAILEGVWDWNMSTGHVTFSRTWPELFGYSLDEIEHNIDTWSRMLHPDDKDAVTRHLTRHLEGETKYYVSEHRMKHRDGRWIWILGRGRVVQRDAEGRPLRMIGADLDITERRCSENALRESEQRLSFHLQNTPVAVIEWNRDFEVVAWNAAAERIFGYAKEEAMGRHAAGLIVPESAREHVNRVWKGLLKNTGGFHSTNENFTKDGRTIVCDWNNTPLSDGSGAVIGVASLVQDITKREQAEDALRKSEEQYRLVVDNTDTGFVVVDDEGAVVEANEPYLRLVGAEELDDIIGRSVIEWTAPECKEKNTAAVALCAKQGFIKDFETTYIRNDGTQVIVLINAVMQETSEGLRLAAQCRDITERKLAEDALRESEEKYRVLFEEALDAIFVHTLKGEILDVNERACQMLGYSRDQLLSMTVQSLHHEREMGKCAEALRTTKEKGSKFFESSFITADGSTLIVSISSKVVDPKHGTIQGIVRDITETRRLQELESRAERLESAGTIAGQVAHDFNNLLAPLIAYPDFIREELPGNHPALAYLDDIERSAKNIAEINQQLLTLGRRGHYNQETLNLNAIVNHAVKEMESLPATVTCELELAEDLMNIKGGSAQVHRVISNLLHNAKDAIRDIGQITIRTENYYVDAVSTAYGRVPKGEYVKLTISDTGCGISEDIVQKIFDPFFTTKTSNKKRGSGLGMSVVDAVIKDHNGYIDLSTKVGEGTSFYVYIPITRESVDSQDSDTIGGGSETILIVDDDDVQREVSSRLLRKLGYEVDTIESGEQALEFLCKNQRDLVILDMIMPGGMDGTETYRRILQISPHQKAIILSGFSESDRVFEVQKLGAGAFVRKPVTKNVIAAAVRVELDRVGAPVHSPL